jgi:DNA replication protein DnaC
MLRLEEWMDIKALFNSGYPQRAIAELTGRSRNTVSRVLKQPRPPVARPDSLLDPFFDFAAQPAIDKSPIEGLATGRFLYEWRSVVFLGPPGVEKTHLAISLGVLTAEMGHRVYFTTAIEMARKLSKAMAENRPHRELNNMTRPKLLVIDEVGYLQLDTAEVSLVFQVISSRYEKGGAIIPTSNKAFSEWGDIFAGDAVMASAALDRLLHRCTVINIRGESYRLKEKRQATKSAFTMPVEESQVAIS